MAALSVKPVSPIGLAVAVFFKQLREGAKPAVLMEKPVPTFAGVFCVAVRRSATIVLQPSESMPILCFFDQVLK